MRSGTLPPGPDDDRADSSLGQVLRMSWPASVTMLNVTILRFVDGLMVAQVSKEAFAAQFIGGMASFIFEGFFTGLLTVVNTYVAQNLGAGRYRKVGQYAWAGIVLAWAAAVAMSGLAVVAPHLFGLFGHAPKLQALETMYFRYMILAIGVSLSSRVIEQFFYGVGRPMIVLTASLASNAFNIGANYVLIFGVGPFKAMGLEGAAIGSVSAYGLHLLILGAVFLGWPALRSFETRRCGLHIRQVADLVRVGWPAGVNLGHDILTWQLMMSGLVASFGTTALAASTAAVRWMGLSFMPAIGLGMATTALVGQAIGAGRLRRARHHAHKSLAVVLTYMGICGLAFLLFRRPMIELFTRHNDVSPDQVADIVNTGSRVLLCAVVFQLFDALRIAYVGALRGAGDTHWVMAVTIAVAWSVCLGGGWLVVRFIPQWGAVGPWIAAAAYVCILGILTAWRFESGAWQRIDLLGKSPQSPPPAEPADRE